MQHGIDSAWGDETNNSSKTYLSFYKGTEVSSAGYRVFVGRLDPREPDLGSHQGGRPLQSQLPIGSGSLGLPPIGCGLPI